MLVVHDCIKKEREGRKGGRGRRGSGGGRRDLVCAHSRLDGKTTGGGREGPQYNITPHSPWGAIGNCFRCERGRHVRCSGSSLRSTRRVEKVS